MLGEIVKAARIRRGLSQRTLAIRSGVTQASISRIEGGLESPAWERFEQLMLAMGEQASVAVEPLEHNLDDGELRLAASRTPSERLREAASWNRAMARLHGTARG